MPTESERGGEHGAPTSAGLMLVDTGEAFEWAFSGHDAEGRNEWEQSTLEVVLQMVPHLVDAVDRCKARGGNARVAVVHIAGSSDGD